MISLVQGSEYGNTFPFELQNCIAASEFFFSFVMIIFKSSLYLDYGHLTCLYEQYF